MIIGHDGQPRSASESVVGNPPSDGFGHAAKLGVGTALDAIVALVFQRAVVRPAHRGFEKTVVESGHESCGIYTKNPITAECAEIAEKSKKRLYFSLSRSTLRSRG